MHEPMNPELLALLEAELLSWPDVTKETRDTDVSDFDVTIYRVGRRQIGHLHHDGVADILLPKAVQQELIAEGRADPHRAGFDGVISVEIRDATDVPDVVELFRLSYERATQRSRAA
jgi:hypothetical protein